MGFSSVTQRRRFVRYGIGAILFGVLVATALARMASVSPYGVAAEEICRELLKGSTVGRQALISSVWWPPMPILLRLPIAALVGPVSGSIASIVVAAFFGVAALLLLERMLFVWKAGWIRFGLVAAAGAHPAFLEACLDGSTLTSVTFVALLIVFCLAEWTRFRKLRYLATFAIAAGLLPTFSFELAPWLCLVFLAITIDTLFTRAPAVKKRATLLLTFLPILYVLGLWILVNWLIMGDALYCVRSLQRLELWQGAETVEWVPSTALLWCAAPALLLLLLSLMRANRPGIVLGVVAVAPIALVIAQLFCQMGWMTAPAAVLTLPSACVAAGFLPATLGAARSTRSTFLAVACIATAIYSLSAHRGSDPLPVEESPKDNRLRLAQIEQHIAQRTRYPKVFVCGYASLSLLSGQDARATFVRNLDISISKEKMDYHGHALYILLHAPTGRFAMDSVHWKHKDMFTLGSRSLLYDGDWGNWRLFEIVQVQGL